MTVVGSGPGSEPRLFKTTVINGVLEIQAYPLLLSPVPGVSDARNSHQDTELQFVCVCSIARLCLTLCGHMDYRSPGSSVHGILQARILEWVAISSSRESS